MRDISFFLAIVTICIATLLGFGTVDDMWGPEWTDAVGGWFGLSFLFYLLSEAPWSYSRPVR